eukprot:Skav218040  [mRNA]  locus=scaffold214:604350:604955:- [translate_table: standard]
MMMAQLSLEVFAGDVAASSADDLKTLLPALLAKAEEYEKKCKSVRAEIKQREKEAKRAVAKSMSAQKKAEKKASDALERNKMIVVSITLNGKVFDVEVRASSTVGELRRFIALTYMNLGYGKITKKQVLLMALLFNGEELHTRPRATLHKLKVVNGCSLQASMDTPAPSNIGNEESEHGGEDFTQRSDEEDTSSEDESLNQ